MNRRRKIHIHPVVMDDVDDIQIQPPRKLDEILKDPGFSHEEKEKFLLDYPGRRIRLLCAVEFYKGTGEVFQNLLRDATDHEGLLIRALTHCPDNKELVSFLFNRTTNYAGCLEVAIVNLPEEHTLHLNLVKFTKSFLGLFSKALKSCPENTELLISLYGKDSSARLRINILDFAAKSTEFLNWYIHNEVPDFITIFATKNMDLIEKHFSGVRVSPEIAYGTSSMSIEERIKYVDFDYINDECFVCLLDWESSDDTYWLPCGHRIHNECKKMGWDLSKECRLH